MGWMEALVEASRGSAASLERVEHGLVGPEHDGVRLRIRPGAMGAELVLSEHVPRELVFPVPMAWAPLRPILDLYLGASPSTARARLRVGVVPERDAILARLTASPFVVPAEVNQAHGLGGDPERRVAVRTRFSGAHVEIAAFGGLLLATVSYPPARQADTLRLWNAARRASAPLDLPVDVAALFDAHAVVGPASLVARLVAERSAPQLVADLLAAQLLGADLTPAHLATLASHEDPEVRRAVISVAGLRGFRELLEQRAGVETEARLLPYLDHYLGR